jgi:DNA polymerase-3 subunit gamma/tau
MAGDPSTGTADPARRDAPPGPTALYRRYRPATFAELKGQDHVTEPLRQALRSGRINHAYLFSGPRGCGKTSSARILARSLNCEQGPTPDPCGVCASCVALAPSGPGSIDVIEIDAASHGGVDDARDLRERAFYAPVSGRFKIYIVDEAHMVTREGFNALLKLVEEPPPHLKFVFATTEPEKVIATIRSRTHHYPFRLMPPAVLRKLLEDILAAEGVSFEPAVLPVVVRAGAGSARDSLSILDQLLAGSGEEGLTYERAVALLGYTDNSLLDEVAEAFAAGDGAAVFRAVDRVVEAGHDPRRFAADLLDRIRDLIVLAAVPDAAETGLLDIPGDRLDGMREQAASFGQARLTSAAEIINTGLVEMRGATSPRLQLELICAQVLLPASATGESALLARLERLEQRFGSGAGAAGQPGAGPAQRESLAARAVGDPGREAPGRGASGHTASDRVASGHGEAHGASGAVVAGATVPGTAASGTAASEAAAPDHAESGRGGSGAVAAGRPGTGAAGTAPTRHGADRSGSAASVDGEAVRERWPEILEAVKRDRRVAWMLLSNATVDTLQEGVLTLRFAKEGEARGFLGSGHAQALSQVLEAMLGISPQIRAIAGPPPEGRGGGGTGGVAGGGGPGSGGADMGVSADTSAGGTGADWSAPGGDGQGGDGGRGAVGSGDRVPGRAEQGSGAGQGPGADRASAGGAHQRTAGRNSADAAGTAPGSGGAAGTGQGGGAGQVSGTGEGAGAGVGRGDMGAGTGSPGGGTAGGASGQGSTSAAPGSAAPGSAAPGFAAPGSAAAVSAAAASARAAASGRSGTRPGGRAARSGGRGAAAGYAAPPGPDEEWPDDDGVDPGDPGLDVGAGAPTGLDLIQRTLGGQIIAEIGSD